jgi:hypothetical protein
MLPLVILLETIIFQKQWRCEQSRMPSSRVKRKVLWCRISSIEKKENSLKKNMNAVES